MICRAEQPFVIAEMSPAHHLVWEKPDSTWALRLTCQPDGGTVLVTRLKPRHRLRLSAALTVPLLEFGDFAMMRKMLRGIKARAGASASSRARAGDSVPMRELTAGLV